jgi:hypothetical protein
VVERREASRGLMKLLILGCIVICAHTSSCLLDVLRGGGKHGPIVCRVRGAYENTSVY